MAFTYGFYNALDHDRKYNAEQISRIFDTLLNDGVFSHVEGIYGTAAGEGLQVIVKPGLAWFNHTWNQNDSSMPLSLAPADVTLTRYDAVVLEVKNMTMASKLHKNNAVKNVSLKVRRGEIVCLAGIDGNGQTEFVYGLTGLEPLSSGSITLCGQDITHASIRKRSKLGMSHIPEDRHKHGLVLDYSLENNMVLQRYFEPEFTNKAGFLRRGNIRKYAEGLIEQYDVRSGQGPVTIARSMSGGNQQKAIIAREIDKNPELLVAVQPTRGLDVGAIEYIHRQLVAQRDAGKAVLLVSLELDEVMDVPDRILVMYEGEIVGELDPKKTTQEELGLYMAGAKRDEVKA